MAQYKNPWHIMGKKHHGPAMFVTDKKPILYNGYEIYNRQSSVFDVVRNDICVTQRVTLAGARHWIDDMSVLIVKSGECPVCGATIEHVRQGIICLGCGFVHVDNPLAPVE